LIGVIIDTNFFVSGVFWKGPPAQVLEAWSRGSYKLIVTTDILLEYERVLTGLAKKYKFTNYERILEIVTLNAEVATPVSFARPICRDIDDDLLVLNGHQNLQIMKPKAFLNEILSSR